MGSDEAYRGDNVVCGQNLNGRAGLAVCASRAFYGGLDQKASGMDRRVCCPIASACISSVELRGPVQQPQTLLTALVPRDRLRRWDSDMRGTEYLRCFDRRRGRSPLPSDGLGLIPTRLRVHRRDRAGSLAGC